MICCLTLNVDPACVGYHDRIAGLVKTNVDAIRQKIIVLIYR
ncbi:hypothetical protein [uncultured Bacteroides sp.]|nr:hypothetical protein [uncultured Bacteroides sp.]